jgi:hypothetical protein
MIPIGATEAAQSRVCVFDLQLFGVGKGILCEQPARQVVIDTACQAFEPIRYSRNDTAETVRQVRAHNAAWDALCKGD